MPSARGLSGSRWPVHPHRLDDELFSSWLVRTAYANGLKVQSFSVMALGRGATVWNRDPDRSTPIDTVERLSAQTGSSVDELLGGMLSSYAGTFIDRHNPKGNTKWILPLGIYHRTRRCFGLQYCPWCLREDGAPYFRRRWRLAFATVCDVHGCMLHDRCPKCESPVVYFRNDLGRRSGYRLGDVVSCWKCDFDLSGAGVRGAPGPDGPSLVALRSLVTFPDLGWWWQGDATLHYAHLYYDVLHHLVDFLSTAHGQKLQQAVRNETGFPGDPVPGPRPPFEFRAVGERHTLLATALWLLDEWPVRFVRAARLTGLSQSYILRGADLPFWFASRVKQELYSGKTSVSRKEVESAAAVLAKGTVEPSRASICRALGNRGERTAAAYRARRESSEWHFEKALALFEREIAQLKLGSKLRLILQRDRTIFRLIRMTGWSVPRALALKVSDAVTISATAKERRTLPAAAGPLLMNYLRDTRRYMASDESADGLFIAYRRGKVTPNAFSERLRRMTAKYGFDFSSALIPEDSSTLEL